MKKVELHLHLDGSLDIEYASKLVGRDVYDEMVSNNDKTLKEYLNKFELPCELLTDYSNIVGIISLVVVVGLVVVAVITRRQSR